MTEGSVSGSGVTSGAASSRVTEEPSRMELSPPSTGAACWMVTVSPTLRMTAMGFWAADRL